jgi:thiosulfate/3-mercaptopyruvate sulfurtransferase
MAGHIEGALNLPISDFIVERGGTPGMVPTAMQFEALMQRLGISPDDSIVAYAEHDSPFAARFVWTMIYYGHARALVLDGGWEKWTFEQRPVSQQATAIAQPVSYQVSTPERHYAGKDYLVSQLGNPTVIIWDARTDQEYDGSRVRAERGGHIPGARHLNWTALQHEERGIRVLRDEAELRKLLAGHGIIDEREVIVHCQTGVRSAYASLVLLGLGYDKVRNYDGSWIEWANDPAMPIATGRAQTPDEELAALRREEAER